MPAFSPRERRLIRERLPAWYAQRARDLPWRRSRDPYRIWLSEVMLQQTQVETVKPYFERFLTAFPRVEDLAAADVEQVLRLWEGLGYYRRARSLHAAARQVVAEFGGQFPDDVPSLMTLPGIGRYTAGAIASIAFDRRAPILEANTIRLFSRLTLLRSDPTATAAQRSLWAAAEEVLPESQVAEFNQALMELGSLVCTPRAPSCDACPIAAACRARAAGAQEEIPATHRKLKFEAVREAAVIVRRGERLLIRQCGADERWAGLWDFPRFPLEAEGPLFVADELHAKVCLQTGVRIVAGPLRTTIKHGVTRFRITLECYEAQFAGGRTRSSAARPVRWVDCAQLAELPLSATGRRLAKVACACGQKSPGR
jgi:A/G-specific adenine glycosylase